MRVAAALAMGLLPALLALLPRCSDEESARASAPIDAGSDASAGSSGAGGVGGTGGSSGGGADGAIGDADASDPGPNVDRSDPQLYSLSFSPADADPQATEALGTELAFLDTRAEPRGILVVYLHGAGQPTTCGSQAHGEMLAALGFHVLSPCYVSDYGVGNCGDDIEGCRLEAFEGVDHHSFIDITPPNSIETRVVKALAHLAAENAQGDWTYFLEADKPRWSRILISGISHGASSAGVIGMHRLVHRAVMLSGPYDVGQAWLQNTPLTPIGRFWGFSHTGDSQHTGHLAAFEAMGLSGSPTSVDGQSPPYGGSQRLISSAATSDGHSSVQAGGASPKTSSGEWLYQPVWATLYASP